MFNSEKKHKDYIRNEGLPNQLIRNSSALMSVYYILILLEKLEMQSPYYAWSEFLIISYGRRLGKYVGPQ